MVLNNQNSAGDSYSTQDNLFSNSPESKLLAGLESYVESGDFPSGGYKNRVLVLSSSNTNLGDYLYPKAKVGINYLHFLPSQTPIEVRGLSLDRDVISIYPDLQMNYSLSSNTPSQVVPDSFNAKEIMGLQQVWDEFNITGDGIKLGIIDSGVDFGISDLEDSAVLLSTGYTASYDTTGHGIAVTNYTVQGITVSNKLILPLEGKTLTARIGETGGTINNEEMGIDLKDLDISGISKPSLSNNYKIGMIFQQGLQESIPDQIFLFVLTDSSTSGVYDTLYIDFSTSLALSLVYNGLMLSSSKPYLALTDWSLNDESPIDGDNPIANRDLTGDGVADISAGALITALNRDPEISNQIHIRGIDPLGRSIALMYDAVGHGTLSASVAVGRGTTLYPIFDDKTTEKVENSTLYSLPGSAPSAKIIAIKGFSISDFALGWFWAAGLELSITGDLDTINTEHRVDLTSNSWGDASIASAGSIKGMDIYSLLLDLMSVEELLYEGYPGMVFVVASGNGGSGYGTLATPGAASLAITIGASNDYTFLGHAGRNDVAWFSARGPTPYGQIKPDLVAPGNTGFTPHNLIEGLGNGTYAYGLFGGTSESTPRAAGVVALLMEAFEAQGMTKDLGRIRTILKSTATDLGFPATAQGSGLISAYEAVSSIFGGNQFIISSTTGSALLGLRLQAAFQNNFGSDIDHPLVTNPIPDSSITLDQDQLDLGIAIKVHYANDTPVDLSQTTVSTQQLVLVGSNKFSFDSQSGEFTRINLENSLPLNFRNSDLLQISLSMTEASWDSLLSSGLGTPDIILYDADNNRYVYDIITERAWVQQLYSGNPSEDFIGEPHIQFTDPGYIEKVPEWTGLKYNALAQTFSYNNWVVNAVKSASTITLSGDLNGSYQLGSLKVASMRIPVIYAPVDQVGYGEDAHYYPTPGEKIPYSLNEAYGSFDWGYRPESGDFRFYQFELPSNASFFVIQASWLIEGLLPDLYLFNATGHLVSTTDVIYLGGGVYESKTSEPKAQNIIIPVEGLQYTLLVHFAQMPFRAGPVEFKIFSRYLTLTELPTPQTSFSQDINEAVSGEFTISSENYSILEFPEIKIDKMDVMVAQGRRGVYTTTIAETEFIEGPAIDFLMTENFYFLELEKGEKVDLSLTWNNLFDVDLYVTGPTGSLLVNDLLNGLGTTPGGQFEHASFDAKEDGLYIIYIDFVYAGDTGDLDFQLTWNSQKGPVLQSNHSSLTMDTRIFPNDNFQLLIEYFSNFKYNFQVDQDVSFDNHVDFTSNLLSPDDGEVLSGIVNVEWETSRLVTAEVIVLVNEIESIVGNGITTNTFQFNSELYSNGVHTLRVKLSDGIYTHTHEIFVEFDNDNPSVLPSISSTNTSLPFTLPVLFVLGVISIIRKKK